MTARNKLTLGWTVFHKQPPWRVRHFIDVLWGWWCQYGAILCHNNYILGWWEGQREFADVWYGWLMLLLGNEQDDLFCPVPLIRLELLWIRKWERKALHLSWLYRCIHQAGAERRNWGAAYQWWCEQLVCWQCNIDLQLGWLLGRVWAWPDLEVNLASYMPTIGVKVRGLVYPKMWGGDHCCPVRQTPVPWCKGRLSRCNSVLDTHWKPRNPCGINAQRFVRVGAGHQFVPDWGHSVVGCRSLPRCPRLCHLLFGVPRWFQWL